MTEKDVNPTSQGPSESGSAAKKQYQEPDFRFEQVFETMALACGKVQPTSFQCRFHRMNS
jgi:hypothetical protein